MRVLTREELTATLAHRQGLITRWNTTPAEAIKRLTPLQGQEPKAPYVALAARVEGFERAHLEQAITDGDVVKTTINRTTLHLVAAEHYPAYHQLTCQPRLRAAKHDLDVEELAAWFETPRTNTDIRAKIPADDLYTPVLLARTLVPLIQLPPAGHYGDTTRNTRFVKDPRPLPTLEQAAKTVLTQYLAAFGPAQRRDIASWSGAPQRDFDFDAIRTVTYKDEQGRTLIDLPDQEILPGDTPLPPRFLSNWDQPLLAYKDRDRILPPEVQPLKLTLSGDQTMTVAGRVVASWRVDEDQMTITRHIDFPEAGVKEEALRTARFLAPHARAFEVVMK